MECSASPQLPFSQLGWEKVPEGRMRDAGRSPAEGPEPDVGRLRP